MLFQHIDSIPYFHLTSAWPLYNCGFPLNLMHFDWCARAPVAEFRSRLVEAPLCHSTEPYDVLLLRLCKVSILPFEEQSSWRESHQLHHAASPVGPVWLPSAAAILPCRPALDVSNGMFPAYTQRDSRQLIRLRQE
jgi:hypothetical protein